MTLCEDSLLYFEPVLFWILTRRAPLLFWFLDDLNVIRSFWLMLSFWFAAKGQLWLHLEIISIIGVCYYVETLPPLLFWILGYVAIKFLISASAIISMFGFFYCLVFWPLLVFWFLASAIDLNRWIRYCFGFSTPLSFQALASVIILSCSLCYSIVLKEKLTGMRNLLPWLEPGQWGNAPIRVGFALLPQGKGNTSDTPPFQPTSYPFWDGPICSVTSRYR